MQEVLQQRYKIDVLKKKLFKQDKKYTEHLAEVTGELKRI
jgi:hypothetical protein